MKAHRNFPFFVPHAGCPNCCVFCSQTKITGVNAEKDIDTEIGELRAMLESVSDNGCEGQIAFFGGSFTAIEKSRMEALLSVANEYIDRGVAESIRISTRPDCIDEDIARILKKYRVKNVEIGVQSTNRSVLELSERGHTAGDSFAAAELILKNRMELCGQMMIGLPGSDAESEMQTARDIVKMGATEARIYPTVVFEGTKLYGMTLSGEYTPLTDEEAVDRAAKCYKILHEAGVKLLRIGLHASENLKNAPFGANHPAIGELVKSRVYTDIIEERAGDCHGKILGIGIKETDISMLRGHGSAAIIRLKERTGASAVEIFPTDLRQFDPKVDVRSV